jgi:SAM-dependent methyltransferase
VKDVLGFCRPEKGVWIDLGAGKGQVAIPLIEETENPVVMIDPDDEAMAKGLALAREKGLQDKLLAVVGVAEKLPLPDNSVDLLVSRGSIFFWDEPVTGLREVYRVLRPGCKAYIGGGAGSGYPKEVVAVLIADRKRKLKGEEAEKWQKFIQLRRPEQMHQWARAAGLADFRVMGKGAISADDELVGQGVWLLFEKLPEISVQKQSDKVSREVTDDAAVYTVVSPGGIGRATLAPHEGWTKRTLLRLRLRGLESLKVTAGDVVWQASILRSRTVPTMQRSKRSILRGSRSTVCLRREAISRLSFRLPYLLENLSH